MSRPYTWIAVGVALLAMLAGLAALALTWGPSRWAVDSGRSRVLLRDAVVPADPKRFDAAELDGLPPPVARYLRLVLRDGQPLPQRVQIAWQGRFNLGSPGQDRWKPLAATQDYTVQPPGFVWDARITMFPGVPVLVRDGFVRGHGSMKGRVAGLVTVVDRGPSPAMDEAALTRHLGEAVWFPGALLPSQGVQWTPIDSNRARATLQAGGVRASAEFVFGTDGLPESVTVSDRLYDDGRHPPTRHPWRARLLRWADHEGVPVPEDAVAEWLLPDSVYAYWSGGPVSVQAEP